MHLYKISLKVYDGFIKVQMTWNTYLNHWKKFRVKWTMTLKILCSVNSFFLNQKNVKKKKCQVCNLHKKKTKDLNHPSATTKKGKSARKLLIKYWFLAKIYQHNLVFTFFCGRAKTWPRGPVRIHPPSLQCCCIHEIALTVQSVEGKVVTFIHIVAAVEAIIGIRC